MDDDTGGRLRSWAWDAFVTSRCVLWWILQVTLSFDETTTIGDVDTLFKAFAGGKNVSIISPILWLHGGLLNGRAVHVLAAAVVVFLRGRRWLPRRVTCDPVWCFQVDFSAEQIAAEVQSRLPPSLERASPFLTHPVFNQYHSEHELLRYLHRLQAKDLSLVHSMIPLGSCTMKLNATTEMIPVTWPELANLHPFAPEDQVQGYQQMFEELGDLLCEITGFDSMSLQPNAGAAGEYAGLMVIRAYHLVRSGDVRGGHCSRVFVLGEDALSHVAVRSAGVVRG